MGLSIRIPPMHWRTTTSCLQRSLMSELIASLATYTEYRSLLRRILEGAVSTSLLRLVNWNH